MREDRQVEWLAGQLDEIELALNKIADEISKVRTVITMLLISVCVSLIAIPSFVFFHK